jgi:5-methylcytosine-specific restriction enzyme subunit McrC
VTRLEVRENGEWTPAPFSADVLERACLTGLVESKLTAAGPQVKPQLNRVGSVAIGADEIVVQPKAPFASVLFMLGYAADPGFRPDEVSGAGDSLVPAVAETYARLMERALGRGVLQGYRRLDESAVTVRGRIRFSDQMSRRGAQLLPVELTIDDYTTDIAENQLLRAAARLLLSLPRLPADARRRLAHLDGQLSSVTPLLAGRALPPWQPSRLNERYHAALHFAELVLARISPTQTDAGVPVASFVVNMAEAFEGFVTAALTSAFAEISPGVSVGQYPTHLDEERRQPIRPDFVHTVGGVPTVVMDAKYKIGSPRVEDTYQMLAYCTALGLAEGTLIYVADQNRTAGRAITVVGANVSIMAAKINIAAEPTQILEQVRMVLASRSQSLHGHPSPVIG